MMQKQIALANQFEKRSRVRLQRNFAWGKRLELQIRAGRLFVEVKHARKINWPVNPKNLKWGKPEFRFQPIDNFLIGPRFNLETPRLALAPPVKLRIHCIQNAARFFVFQIKVAVASHAKSRSRKY